MERFILDNGDFLTIDCTKCSMYGYCSDWLQCVEELKRRLWEYENRFFELELKGKEFEKKLLSHPLLVKLFKDSLKG